MRKYILTVCAFFIHNIITDFEIINTPTETFEKGVEGEVESKKSKRKITKKEVGDTHTATWYNLHGNRTASGDRFHKDSLTAAYNFLKLGSYLRITNLSNDKSIVVKVNDRMGIKTSNRIDLSKCAFDSIASIGSGRIKVKIEFIK